MNITVPIYAEEIASGATGARQVSLRPLFFENPRDQDESIQRGTARLSRHLRRELTRLARTARHEELAAFGFYPPLEDRILKLNLVVGNRRFSVRHLFITTSAFGRRLAWTPSVPDLWFEVARGETLEQRAEEVLVEHYKLLERRFGADAVRPDAASVKSKAWITSIEVSIDVPSVYVAPVDNIFAVLGSTETSDGPAELEKVGRSLNSLYPDELGRASNREAEVTELTRLLSGSDNQPVVLTGKRLVGKSAIIHEFVRRRMDRRRSSETTLDLGSRVSAADIITGDVWLISPQRLISGMSYVGQWEARLLAILKEAKRKNHTLYFDDLSRTLLSGPHERIVAKRRGCAQAIHRKTRHQNFGGNNAGSSACAARTRSQFCGSVQSSASQRTYRTRKPADVAWLASHARTSSPMPFSPGSFANCDRSDTPLHV